MNASGACRAGRCPFCDGSLEHGRGSRFAGCSRCRARVRNPLPQPEELERLYEQSWEEPDLHAAELGGTAAPLARALARRLARAAGRGDLRGQRLLDFGSGRGHLARALAAEGAEVTCVEPYAPPGSTDGVRVVAGLEQLADAEPFTGVVAVEVVEHLLEPVRTLCELRERAEPGGWLYVSTPNRLGLRARLQGDHWSEARKAGHLALHTPRSLGLLLARSGWRDAQRPRWILPHHVSHVRRLAGACLQVACLDGSLRVLAWNR